MKNKQTVYKHGINDMYRGWCKENDWNMLVYVKWKDMLRRVYSEKEHNRNPKYRDCSVCDEWLLFSNFIKDIVKIDGYDENKFLNNELQLDKDIKSNGNNNEYSLKNCMLVSKADNIRQAVKTRDNTYLIGENNHNKKNKIKESTKQKISEANSKIVVQMDMNGNIIKIWHSIANAQTKLKINGISKCCVGKQEYTGRLNNNKYKWRHLKDVDEDKILNYIIKNMQFKDMN